METIKITDRAYNYLKKKKIHPSQPFWEIVNLIIDKIKEVEKNDKKSD